jgi:hypothetical protein
LDDDVVPSHQSFLHTGDYDITLQFGSEHGILYPFHSFGNSIVFYGISPAVSSFVIVLIFNYPTSSLFCSLNQRMGSQSPKLCLQSPSSIH